MLGRLGKVPHAMCASPLEEGDMELSAALGEGASGGGHNASVLSSPRSSQLDSALMLLLEFEVRSKMGSSASTWRAEGGAICRRRALYTAGMLLPCTVLLVGTRCTCACSEARVRGTWVSMGLVMGVAAGKCTHARPATV